MHPPQVGPVTERSGPAQVQGSVGSRSPYDVSAAGAFQCSPVVLGLAGLGDLEPAAVEQGCSQRAKVDVVQRPGPAPRWTWVEPPWNEATPLVQSQLSRLVLSL